jgi:hypothetical protein
VPRSKDFWPKAYCQPPASGPLTHNGRVRLVPGHDAVPVNPMRDYIPGAEWWLCKSRKSVPALLRDFSNGDVACVLYERVGAMLPRGTDGQLFLIAIQLVRNGGEENDWDLCLSEVGVFMEEIIVDILS